MTRVEIARELGITRQMVEKIEKRALRKLAAKEYTQVVLYLHYLESVHEPIDRVCFWEAIEMYGSDGT